MDKTRRKIAEELLTASRAHDAQQEDRLNRYRNLEPESAEMLAVLVRATRPRTILELGTSNGYSTLWLADAAEAVGATITSVELDPERTAQAREQLERAGVQAELRVGDAGEVLLSHAEQVEEVTALIESEPGVTTALVPIGAGVRLVVRG